MTAEPILLWDWNGTLLDDTAAGIAALNELLAVRGLAPISREFYRAHFGFPVKPFYGRIGIRWSSAAEWDRIARDYHDAYARQPTALARGASAALAAAQARGARQFIISASRQDLLERDLVRCGVRAFFEGVYGTDNLDGGTKTNRARQLLADLGARHGAVTVIGDALHDQEVAAALGVGCVLFSGGSHAPERLHAVAPTAETLAAAVELALGTERPRF